MTALCTPRFALGLPLAAAVTLALAMVMQMLITYEEEFPPARGDRFDVVVVSSTDDSKVVERVPPKEPDETTPPPRTPVIDTVDPEAKPGTDQPGWSPPTFGGEKGDGPGGEVSLFSEARLIARTQPIYPSAAIARGQEGECVVSYDVDASGATMNVRATRCTSSVFARASEDAVRRFRYMPRQGELGAEPTYGLTQTIAFEIAE